MFPSLYLKIKQTRKSLIKEQEGLPFQQKRVVGTGGPTEGGIIKFINPLPHIISQKGSDKQQTILEYRANFPEVKKGDSAQSFFLYDDDDFVISIRRDPSHGGISVFVRGRPEDILQMCKQQLLKLSKSEKEKKQKQMKDLKNKGLVTNLLAGEMNLKLGLKRKSTNVEYRKIRNERKDEWKRQKQDILDYTKFYRNCGEKVIAVAKLDLPSHYCKTGRDEYQFNVDAFERWLACDQKSLQKPKTGYFPMTGYTFMGMVTTSDPPKNSANKAIKLLQMQRKKMIVITGDDRRQTKSCME